jgi:hypothetical protein
MSFKLFEVEFDGSKDSFEEGKLKMDLVCKKVGEKLIREWILYGDDEGKINKKDINEVYKWIKVLENYNLKEEIE